MTFTIPWWVLVGIVGVSVVLATYMLGRLHGYDSGVRDTEQRWADAVSRKQAADEAKAAGQEWATWTPGERRC